jgi:hypothetical protein
MNKIRPFVKFTQASLSTVGGRSQLFNNPSLRALREKIKREENPMNRYEADVTRLRTVREEPNKGATGGT